MKGAFFSKMCNFGGWLFHDVVTCTPILSSNLKSCCEGGVCYFHVHIFLNGGGGGTSVVRELYALFRMNIFVLMYRSD